MLQLLDNKVVAHGEGPEVLIGGDAYTILASGADTGGRYAAFAFFVPPGGPPPHRHTREGEVFYVTEGSRPSTSPTPRSC